MPPELPFYGCNVQWGEITLVCLPEGMARSPAASAIARPENLIVPSDQSFKTEHYFPPGCDFASQG